MISKTSLSTPSSVKLWTMSPVMVPEVATELEETVELEDVLELLEETEELEDVAELEEPVL